MRFKKKHFDSAIWQFPTVRETRGFSLPFFLSRELIIYGDFKCDINFQLSLFYAKIPS